MIDEAAAARRDRATGPGYVTALVVLTLPVLGWLAAGAAVAAVRYRPAVAPAPDGAWARGLLAAAPRSEPLVQVVLDHACSGLNLLLAAVLLRAGGGPARPLRLLALAMIASAGAFNLQARTTGVLLQVATGVPLGPPVALVLVAVACGAAAGALLVFPEPGPGRWGGAGAVPAVAGAACVLLAVGVSAVAGTATGGILFFGYLAPVAGLVALGARIRAGTVAGRRTQVRLLLCALAATLATATVLTLVTVVLAALHRPGLLLGDPAAPGPGGGPPVALLFWFARVGSVALAAAALVAAGTGSRLRTADRWFGRGLAVTLVAAPAGGVVTVLQTLAAEAGTGPVAAAALAAAPVAVLFLPLYLQVERLVDRLLYGTRPTPYTVLAGVNALSGTSASTDGPDLVRAAEAVGRGLGATVCRLTVYRPGLRDRTYSWTAERAAPLDDPDALVRVPVRQRAEELGEIAVDREAVQGLRGERRHLLPDIADSLGVVLRANRSAIELERQLRAALAHGERIAAARRDAVARMDAERRRIERDLHDGAQHRLVSLGLGLGLVEHQVSAGAPEPARARLDDLLTEVDVTESVLAETAGGVSSAMLSGHGLVAVLRDTLAASDPPVTIEHEGVPSARCYPDEIGDTAYFCCLEAVNNARKHARGAPVTVRVAERDGMLRMEVRDDGPGFVPDPGPGTPATQGRGLRNLTVRLVAVGGTVAVRSAPGAGTTVLWSLPLPEGWSPDPEPGSGPAAGTAPAQESGGLRERVRDLVCAGAEVYAGTEHAATLARAVTRLDAPPAAATPAVDTAGYTADRSTLLAARTALQTLEGVVGSVRPPPRGTERLRYRIERLRAEAHELVEIELADVLRTAGPVLPRDDRAAADRLLGACGAGPRARLGLPDDAGSDEVRRAAERELHRWQRLAGHPGATGPVRDAAQVLVRTCEHLLAERPAGADRPG
ncbi:ATP-binding protein [Pseudonocardia nantongensis]|uniref:sensor histidine kinase n=1 Tax=Pseudonocardia nantongensis TaxID=1181885 RepID=UPI00397BFFD7